MKYAILILLMIVASCAKTPHQSVQHSPNETVVHYHGGGNIPAVMHQINTMRQPIKVSGLCASTCTYALAFQDTCVTKNAQFIFHAPRMPNGDISNAWLYPMANWYNDGLRAWFLKRVEDDKDKDYTLRGYDLINRFGIKQC